METGTRGRFRVAPGHRRRDRGFCDDPEVDCSGCSVSPMMLANGQPSSGLWVFGLLFAIVLRLEAASVKRIRFGARVRGVVGSGAELRPRRVDQRGQRRGLDAGGLPCSRSASARTVPTREAQSFNLIYPSGNGPDPAARVRLLPVPDPVPRADRDRRGRAAGPATRAPGVLVELAPRGLRPIERQRQVHVYSA